MATNLIELFKNTIGDTLIRQTSGLLGESAQSISSSLGAIVPSLIGTMVLRANADSGVKQLRDYISSNGLEDVTLIDSSEPGSGNQYDQLMTKGSHALKFLVGENESQVIDAISAEGGLKTSSSSSLLKMVAPLLMGFVARFSKENSSGVSGLKELLLMQRDFVVSGTPPHLKSLLGISSLDLAYMNSSVNTPGTNEQKGSTGMSKYLPWLVLLLTSLGLFYFLQKGCNAPTTPPESTNVTAKSDTSDSTPAPTLETPPDIVAGSQPASPETGKSQSSKSATNEPSSELISEEHAGEAKPPRVTGTGHLKTYTLPNNSKLILEANHFASQLIEYLEGNEPPGKCFAFDEVTFEAGSDKINKSSTEQLGHLNLIMNAYPKVNIMITGYTSDVGDAATNLKLSVHRAFAVYNWHVNQGIPSPRMQYKGMGESNPIASNATKEGQAKNQRVEVCVLKKK